MTIPGMPNAQVRDYDKDAAISFRRLDKDGNGVLSPDDVPEWLADEFQQWDKNGDGKLDLAEYKEAYKARQEFLDQTYNQDNPNQRNRNRTNQQDLPGDEDKRPTVYRVGHLPKELPPWFEQLDTDKDGQVGLYEWKKANPPRDINEFLAIDKNGDGFLTVEEVLRWQRAELAKKKGGTGVAQPELDPDGNPITMPATIPGPGTYPGRGPGRGPGSPGTPPGQYTPRGPGGPPSGADGSTGRPGRGGPPSGADGSTGKPGRGGPPSGADGSTGKGSKRGGPPATDPAN